MTHTPKDYIIMCAVFGLSVFVFTIFSSSLIKIGREQVALVSEVGASVSETPTNKLAAELRDKSKELTEKERLLNEREAVLLKEKESIDNRLKNVLLTTLFLSLITLLVVNGYVYKRSKNKSLNKESIYGHSLDYTPRNRFRIDLHNLR